MANTKHKDVTFYVQGPIKASAGQRNAVAAGRVRAAKGYEDAILEAASIAATSGKTVMIDVYARSLEGAKWYNQTFGPPKDAVKAYNLSKDENPKIDTLKLTLK